MPRRASCRSGFLANTNKKQALITIRKSLGLQLPTEETEDPRETAAAEA